jgi:hypothetical protein
MTRRRPGSTKKRTSRFGIYLDSATHAALLKAAIDEGTSATALLEALLRQYLVQRSRRRGPR